MAKIIGASIPNLPWEDKPHMVKWSIRDSNP